MTVRLFELENHPTRIAVSKTDEFVADGTFFLDFTRPIEVTVRCCGWLNDRFGIPVGLAVPVVHQGEKDGGSVIGVHSSEPYFKRIRALWKARYPSIRATPTTTADGFKIIADFATQFPNDCR